MDAEKIVFAQIPEHPTYLDFNITIKKYNGSVLIRKFSRYDQYLRFVLALVELIFTKFTEHLNQAVSNAGIFDISCNEFGNCRPIKF